MQVRHRFFVAVQQAYRAVSDDASLPRLITEGRMPYLTSPNTSLKSLEELEIQTFESCCLLSEAASMISRQPVNEVLVFYVTFDATSSDRGEICLTRVACKRKLKYFMKLRQAEEK
jgi:hypothetical protein